jgi:asparagine synthase (glutamine-hydrolysing)
VCGIAGVLSIGPHAGPVRLTELEAMRDTMAHRGPDGTGAWLSPSGTVGLAHRRLAIIDLSDHALQPMTTDDDALSLVFNGEIYNHAELRAELTASGERNWRTDHSDTEVILRAYQRWGFECVHRFRGMFAFALWDGRRRQLWLVRDRLGVKPLYYATAGGKLRFASEIKALLADPALPRRVNEAGLFHYLSFLTVPAPATLFDGISKLECGSWMLVGEDGAVGRHRYWDPWEHVDPRPGVSADEAAKGVLERLSEAVALRQVADVPVGVFLSGGIDSSTNAALFSADEGDPIRTFSIGYSPDHPSYRNELDFARLMADEVGAAHHELLLTPDDVVGFLDEMVRLQDEPIADPVCVPLAYLSRLARDAGVKVCQVGEGADELFCGYDNWHSMLRLQRLDRRTGMQGLKAAAAEMVGRLPSHRLANDFRLEHLRRAGAGQPVFWSGAESFTDAAKRRLLSPRLRERFRSLSSWDVVEPIHRRYLDLAWEKSDLNWMTYVDLNLRLPELLLMRVDKMSMGASLECRVPFLDHRLVEDVLSLPTAVRLAGDRPKALLRNAVGHLLPEEILDRPKQGFGMPVKEFFLDRLGDLARREVRDFCAQTDLLDQAEADRHLDGGHGWPSWYLLNLALWWKAYIR